ncbi:hypothetical protein Y1Q_0016416 [Alligator mississippiensis]|uniref:Uncharacterized protein n=1 Tax=Alligator mississippiensis TaxID=8496 RepID=A0A151N2J5_ALLMI|nr:hypothetical protein Y1Q_0016416 [Alligator mississippiensis]
MDSACCEWPTKIPPSCCNLAFEKRGSLGLEDLAYNHAIDFQMRNDRGNIFHSVPDDILLWTCMWIQPWTSVQFSPGLSAHA